MNDGKIVDLYLERNEEAIKYTSDKYGASLRRIAYGIVNDKSTAEECENDTYVRAWNSIPPHEPREYLFAFLARITRHIALDICKERRALKRTALICELSAELEQCIPYPDDKSIIDSITLCDGINKFLGTLESEKRNVFIRRYWYMDSISAISKRYSISQSKIKSMLLRTRNQLKEFLTKEGYEL